MMGATPQQARLLKCIRDLTRPDGVAPSITELGMAMGISSRGSVHDLLGRLKARGLITWEPKAARSITIVEQGLPERALSEVRLLCADSAREGFAVSRDEIKARLARAMGGQV